MRKMPAPTRTPRSRRSRRASRSGAGRRQRWWARTEWWKEERRGVFLDYNQNAKDRTVASVWRQHFPPLAARARPRASRGRKSKAVAGRQGRAVVDRPADPVCEKCPHPHGRPGRGDRGEHQGVGLDDASAGGRGRNGGRRNAVGSSSTTTRTPRTGPWPRSGRCGVKRLPMPDGGCAYLIGAGRKAGKSANTSPLSRRARARARVEAGNQRPWPADKVERWSIDRLIPYAKNARTHTDAQVAAIAASIKEWGWTTPALVGEDGIRCRSASGTPASALADLAKGGEGAGAALTALKRSVQARYERANLAAGRPPAERSLAPSPPRRPGGLFQAPEGPGQRRGPVLRVADGRGPRS